MNRSLKELGNIKVASRLLRGENIITPYLISIHIYALNLPVNKHSVEARWGVWIFMKGG